MPPTRNARGLATARRIEAAAVRLAGGAGPDGAEGATVDAICAEAGVSQRTFFHHFPTKEDAILGLDLPALDEDRVRTYLSDRSIGVLSGAVALVRLPDVGDEDRDVVLARMRLIASSPALLRRQGERLMPLLQEIRGLVLTRLQALAEPGTQQSEEALHLQADLVTALGAALMQAVGVRALQDSAYPDPEAPAHMLAALRPVWDRLL